MKNITLKANDGYLLSLNIYEAENPKAYIQIIHGMLEHKGRYDYFANKLLNEGYSVIVSDIRGHGPNAPILGYFGDKDCDKNVLDDQLLITKFIKETYKTDNVYIFAHSMGTIFTRCILQEHSNEYNKVILCGYPNYQFGAELGVILAKLVRLFKGGNHFSKLLVAISVGSFNKKIKNPKTPIDWLSCDEENVQIYLNDPYCGHAFKTNSFITLFSLMARMNKVKKYKNVKSLPMLLISGDDDPCTGGEKGTFSSIKTLSKAGFRNLTKITYPNMRHEILHEKEKDKVIDDVLEFLGGAVVEKIY